ncbi:MAG: hypothetical protein ACI4UC_06995, partial [Alloprevotella sp.]
VWLVLLYCVARVALLCGSTNRMFLSSFHKIGGSEEQILKTAFFALLFSRLALSLQWKVGRIFNRYMNNPVYPLESLIINT